MRKINHERCPPGSHTFDAGDPHYEGRVDEYGNQMCNGCPARIFYCTVTNWYHHVGAGAAPCFLAKDQGWDIPAPEPGRHVYQMEHDGARVCIVHGDGSGCPPIDLAALVAAVHGG